MFEKTIEDLIREYVHIEAETGSWLKCFCMVCGDGTHAKGPRGGWAIDGNFVVYSCFNCDTKENFSTEREYPFSEKMREVFDAFGIPKAEYNMIAYKNKVFGNDTDVKVVEKKVETAQPFAIPEYFCEINQCNHDNVIVQAALAELKYRKIPENAYPFYLSTGKTKGGPREEAIARSLMGRLIIPMFNHKGEMIYYQARNLDKTDNRKKYLNPDVPRTAVMYGMDQLNTNIDAPLFVTEGFFDAFHLKGVALLQNSITNSQLVMLRKSRRKKVFVPDKKADSSGVVDAFIKEGWHVSVPDIGDKCKDIDDAIRKYGKLYTLQTVAGNVHEAETGKILMGLHGFL